MQTTRPSAPGCWRFRTRELLTSAARFRSRPARRALQAASNDLHEFVHALLGQSDDRAALGPASAKASAGRPVEERHGVAPRALRRQLWRRAFEHRTAVFRIAAIETGLPAAI